MQWALLFAGFVWLIAARIAAEHAAAGFAGTLRFVAVAPLLTELFFLFLLLSGFTALHWVATRVGGVRRLNALPARKTAGREWVAGAALGWAMLLVAVLPMVLGRALHPDFWLAPRAWGMGAIAVLALGAGALALEVAFRGYLFQRLILAVGPAAATIVMAIVFALLVSLRAGGGGLGFTFALLEGVLFALAYHRTHGLWLGWGLRFGWTASMAVLFGLPVRGSVDYVSIVATTPSGGDWLTGGLFGPDASLCAIVALLLAIPVLYAVTRDYAWNYTHEPIIAGGYAVVVQPPAAHTAMEQAAAATPAPLVQIAAITPAAPSTSSDIERFLRDGGEE